MTQATIVPRKRKAALKCRRSLFANSKRLQFRKAHSGNPLAGTGNLAESTVRKVKRAACNERPTISDGDGHAPVVSGIRHAQSRSKWQCLVGGCKAVSIKAATICSS